MAETHDLVVSAQKLSKSFGDEGAVKDLTFSIPRGSIFGLIGPSGCGKTTTVRLITGIYKPTAGEVTVLGLSPMNFTQHTRQRLGYMPQLFALYSELTVRENLHFSLRCGISKHWHCSGNFLVALAAPPDGTNLIRVWKTPN